MISERRQAAARANGAKSRGPKTVEGKRRSSQNSRTHNLYSRDLIAEDELPDDFAPIIDEIQADFQPESPLAISAMHAMAAAHWQQRRLWRTETETLDAECRRQRSLDPTASPVALRTRAFRWLADHTRLLDLYARCDRRFERVIFSALAILRAEQAHQAKIAPPTQARARHPHRFARTAAGQAPVCPYEDSQPASPRPALEKNEIPQTNPTVIENKGHKARRNPKKTHGNPTEPKTRRTSLSSAPGLRNLPPVIPILLNWHCLQNEPSAAEPPIPAEFSARCGHPGTRNPREPKPTRPDYGHKLIRKFSLPSSPLKTQALISRRVVPEQSRGCPNPSPR